MRAGIAGCAAAAGAGAAGKRIDITRISAITDEIARTPADAIAFVRQYGMKWVELRAIPGGKQYYATMDEPELRLAAKEFRDAGLGVSFLNSGMLKFDLPGTEPARRRQETDEQRARRREQAERNFARRMDDLRTAIRAAHILGVKPIRIFAFSRVAEPRPLFPRIADVVGEMVKVAEKEGVELLIENEGSCNIATCAELAEFLKLIPSRALGINWDPQNGLAYKETPYPDGYALLPKKRLGNVQMKGRGILEGPTKLDWAAIFGALDKDGYKGKVGLETHIFGETQIEMSHACVKEILRILESRG